MVKLVAKSKLDDMFRGFEGRLNCLGANIDLEGEIMLSFSKETVKSSLKSQESFKHALYLDLRQKARYVLASGRAVDLIESCGIQVPQRQEIATITFYQFPEVAPCSPLNLAGRAEDGQVAYARMEEVENALIATMNQIKNYESHNINIRKACPEAKADRNGPAIVSIANIGEYFNKFSHFGKELPRHYLSGCWEDNTFTITPAHAILWVDDSVQH